MVRTVEFTLPELLERLHAGQIPSDAQVRVTYDDAALTSSEGGGNDPTLALFEQWAREDALMTPEAQAENKRICDEIEQNGIPRVQI